MTSQWHHLLCNHFRSSFQGLSNCCNTIVGGKLARTRLARKGIISFGLSMGPLRSDKMYPLPFGYFSNCLTRLGYNL